MRASDEKAFNAFITGKRLNTRVRQVYRRGDDMFLDLFGNCIAKTDRGRVLVSGGGYRPTQTTASQLSCFVNISLYKQTFILDNQREWDGNWLDITDTLSQRTLESLRRIHTKTANNEKSYYQN